jgi:hypothetical protein
MRGTGYRHWDLTAPARLPLDEVRHVGDQIRVGVIARSVVCSIALCAARSRCDAVMSARGLGRRGSPYPMSTVAGVFRTGAN